MHVNHRTTTSIHFEQLALPPSYYPIKSQSSMDLHNGCWKLHSDIHPTLRGSFCHTLTISQTQVDPWSDVYYVTQMHLCSELQQSWLMFSSTRTTIPLQSFRSMKTLHQVHMQYYCLDFRLRQGLLQLCTTCSCAKLCATNLRFSSNFRFPRSLGIPSPWIS